jgi:pyruvate dehydrogenase E2 component (dihydrolipoamide acetyltransferase)
MSSFTMPSLGADMEDGKLVEWLVKPGDAVRKGDIVAVVDTHKGAIDVEIFEEGTILELCAREGETVKVGGLLARLDGEGEKPAAERPQAPPIAAAPKPVPERAAARPAVAFARGSRVKVSPAARRLAGEYGIDPEQLQGTGIDGSVTYADVELARSSGAKPAKPAPPPVRRGGFDPA